jgi:hypothetical protein
VVEHGVEGLALARGPPRGALEMPLQRRQHRPEKARHVARRREEEPIPDSGNPGSRTGLETHGELRKCGRIERIRSDRPVHIVPQPPHRDAAGPRHPCRLPGVRGVEHQQRREGLRLGPGEMPRAPGLAKGRRKLRDALEAQQRTAQARIELEGIGRGEVSDEGCEKAGRGGQR